MWFPDLLLYFKLVSNAPYGGKFPAIMIFDLLAQTLNMHINSTGISNILISPDLIQKLLSCKHLIWRRCQEVKKLQLFRRHLHILPIDQNRIIRQIDLDSRVFHTFSLIYCRNLWFRHCLSRSHHLNPYLNFQIQKYCLMYFHR